MGFFDFLFKKKNTSTVEKTCDANLPPEEVPVKESDSNITQTGFEDAKPNLEMLISEAFPTKEGLYPHETTMMYFAVGQNVEAPKFNLLWSNTFGVSDPHALLLSLVDRGYIGECGIRDVLLQEKVSPLKEELKRLGAKVSGKKEELVDRLISLESESDLRKIFPKSYYSLTEQGKLIIENHPEVSFCYDYYYLANIWEINKIFKGKETSIDEVAQILISKKLEEYEKNKQSSNFNRLAYTCHTLYELYKLVGDNEKAFAMEVQSSWIFQSAYGVNLNQPAHILKFRLKEIKHNYYQEGQKIPNKLDYLKDLAMLGRWEKISEEDFYTNTINALSNIDNPNYCLYTKEEFAWTLISFIKKDEEKLNNIYLNSLARFTDIYFSIKEKPEKLESTITIKIE